MRKVEHFCSTMSTAVRAQPLKVQQSCKQVSNLSAKYNKWAVLRANTLERVCSHWGPDPASHNHGNVLCKGQASRPRMRAGQHPQLKRYSPQYLGKRSAGPVATAGVSHTPETQRNPNQARNSRHRAQHNSLAPPGAELKCSSGPASTGGCPDGATQGSQSLLRSGKPLFKPRVTIPSGFRWIKLGPKVINEDLQWQREMKNC